MYTPKGRGDVYPLVENDSNRKSIQCEEKSASTSILMFEVSMTAMMLVKV
jgi:hypothetical protein